LKSTWPLKISVEPRVDGRELGLLLVRHDLRVEHRGTRLVGAEDAKKSIGVDLVLELAQQSVEREDETVGTAGADLPRIEHPARGGDGRGDQLFPQAARPEQAV
jgi:hypothetical protein